MSQENVDMARGGYEAFAQGDWDAALELMHPDIEAHDPSSCPAPPPPTGLRDPFDPEAAIDAQARMMSGLLRHFGSVRLALAAYNAGSGAVEACRCLPPYPETVAYVARILALLDGSGALLTPPFEVRLIA